MQKALGSVTGMLPRRGKASSSSRGGGRGGRAGGVALMTAAAGLAFRNRDKVASLMRRDRSRQSDPPAGPDPLAGRGLDSAEAVDVTERSRERQAGL